MRVKALLLIVLFGLLILSCSVATPVPTVIPSATVTLIPSPTPFDLYGARLLDLTYCSPESLPQKMDLYFPGEGGPWPVLVYVHGGSWMKGDKAEAAALGAGMTAQGYAVASLNYRMYPTVKIDGMIEDVKCAIRSLRAHAVGYNLDPKRIAAMGASAGAHLVALLGTSDASAGWEVGEYLDQSSRVQAVIAMAVPSDMTQKFSDANLRTLIIVAFGGDLIQAASPVTHITPDDPPFLIIHGDRDPIVPVEQAQILHDQLTEAGVASQLVIVKNGDHSLKAADGSATPTAEEINQFMLEFLAKYLK